jgi:hypothetical protein
MTRRTLLFTAIGALSLAVSACFGPFRRHDRRDDRQDDRGDDREDRQDDRYDRRDDRR